MLKKILLVFSILLTLIIMLIASWLYQLDQQIQSRLQRRMFDPPTEFYTAPKTWLVGEKADRLDLERELRIRQLTKARDNSMTLIRGEYSWLDNPTCAAISSELYELSPAYCLHIKPFNEKETQITFKHLVAFGEEGVIEKILIGDNFVSTDELSLEPLLFAQYYLDKPILRQILTLRDVPAQCLKAVLAIEDPQFLDHGGVSLRGTLRAIVKNTIMGDRSAGGGSTITQQLMKNFFLTSEQTYKRKVIEIAMAALFDYRVPKDRILEAYLNIIYMGQSGPFAVRGFGAASRFYFQKDIEHLNLPECALLAAILNNPGRYNPSRNPETAGKRRTRVLDKMVELGWISQDEFDEAEQYPLPQKEEAPTVPAPYFVDAVRRQTRELNIDLSEGARIYTTMVPEAQSAAKKAVQEGLDAIENWYASLKKKREAGQKLQGVLIAANPKTGHIEALIGGRDFQSAPYNRAVRAHRQIGSIIKPFVYLAALESMDTNGQAYTPVSILIDEQFTYEYQNQSWSPRNYTGTFHGRVPMYYALKNSLNAATARIGLDVGLSSIVDVVRRMGIDSKIEALPAMTLGAYELYPQEVLKAYVALARFGSSIPLTTIQSIQTLSGENLYRFQPEPEQVSSADTVASVVGMLKHTILSGTATAVRKIGFTHPAAGKTGTTSDTRDAWFSGFTPHHVAVAWVGYDENDQHGLTGASGAVPIWTKYMMNYAGKFPADDFHWPENAVKVNLSYDDQVKLGDDEPQEEIELIFRGGTEP